MVKSSYLPSWMIEPDKKHPAPHLPVSGPPGSNPPSEGARNLGAAIGYRRFVDGLQAYCLLRGKQCGNGFVQWLKDHFVEYPPLLGFWSDVLARMALRHNVPFDLVTCPPSSGKREHYLAERLALGVADHLGVSFEHLFFNPTPRGHRASMQEKLREADGPEAVQYVYEWEPDGSHVLVVDDAMCTRQTALRCVAAAEREARVRGAEPDHLYFVVLYS